MPNNKQFEEIEQEPKKDGKYKFYKNENATEKNPDLFSDDETKEIMDYVSDYEWTPLEIADKDIQTPEFKEEVEKRKEWISEFGKKIGLPDLKNIMNLNKLYLVSEEDFEKIVSRYPYAYAYAKHNETIVKNKNEKENLRRSQHDLIHFSCKNNIFLAKESEQYSYLASSTGYASMVKNQNFNSFNEGLIETTNQQIYLENQELAPSVTYFNMVIFITELSKDISQKTEELTEMETLTPREVLARFQRGMFLGKRKYLKIIKDIYGGEVLNILAKMKDDKDSVIETAKVFGLQSAIEKINDFDQKSSTKIDICDYKCHVAEIKELNKFFITREE